MNKCGVILLENNVLRIYKEQISTGLRWGGISYI